MCRLIGKNNANVLSLIESEVILLLNLVLYHGVNASLLEMRHLAFIVKSIPCAFKIMRTASNNIYK